MSELVAFMNEPLQSETQGPGVLIIRLVSLLTTMKSKIQTLERDAQRSRQSESEICAKLSNSSAAQIKEASEAQKENTNSKDMQMRQNVIPILKLQIQSLTSKTHCDALDIKQLILEKEQLTRDLAVLKHQVMVQPLSDLNYSFTWVMLACRCWTWCRNQLTKTKKIQNQRLGEKS
jgi:hypothetical protein